MAHEIVIGRDAVAEVFFSIGRRAEIEEKAIPVGRAEIERSGVGLIGLGSGARVGGHPVESIGKLKGAIRVVVVSQELILRGRLRRGGFDGRVGIDHAHRHLPTRIRDSILPHPAVVVRHMRQQPLDGVVQIRARVGLSGASDKRPVMNELPFRVELPAHVLVDEDVAFLRKRGGGSENAPVGIRPVRWNTVGRALDENRISPRLIFRRVNDRKEPHSVPHGDHVLVLVVIFWDLSGGRPLLRGQAGREHQKDCAAKDGESLLRHRLSRSRATDVFLEPVEVRLHDVENLLGLARGVGRPGIDLHARGPALSHQGIIKFQPLAERHARIG